MNLETQSTEQKALTVQDWGLIEYPLALQRMMDLVDLVHQELARDTFVFCSHPPVVTLGRGTQEGDVFGWNGATLEVNRGGRATYHGPSQVVVYPILDLGPRGRDLHRYMRDLEQAVIRTLKDFGVQATGHCEQIDEAGESSEATGVWIGRRKIASIGIGVRKWVSFHGLALNVDRDEAAFTGMKPCGFSSRTMISLEEVLGRPVDRASLKGHLASHLHEIFST